MIRRLESIRYLVGLTGDEMAHELRISRGTYLRWIKRPRKDEVSPKRRPATLKRLLRLVDRKINELNELREEIENELDALNHE